jgi:hypothetical protein
LDASRNGTVNQNEFIAATAPAPSPTRDVGLFNAAFHMLDGDKDGVIKDTDIERFLMPSPNRAALARSILSESEALARSVVGPQAASDGIKWEDFSKIIPATVYSDGATRWE